MAEGIFGIPTSVLYWLILLVSFRITVMIGLGNCLGHVGTKPLPYLMLTCCQIDFNIIINKIC